MELNANTKINDLLKQHPFLLDFFITLYPKFNNLNNPVVRKTMGKVATLKKAAIIGGLKVEDLISRLSAEIGKQTSNTSATGESVTDSKERREALKEIIRNLHQGKDMEVLNQRLRKLVHGVEATEIAKIEQEFMNEGLPTEEIKRLCDIHVEIFKEALEEQDRPEPPPGAHWRSARI